MKKAGAAKIARLGLMAGIALVLGYVESLVPTGIPGVKLGLSNAVLIYALYLMDAGSAVFLMLVKVGLSGLLFGGFSALVYSFAGGVVSLAAMLLAKKLKGVSAVGVSVLGALAHNAGQMAVAGFVVGWRPMLAYLPLLLAAAAVAGTLTGLAAQASIQALHKAGASGQKSGRGEGA